jgi:hypothetical protein
MAQAGEILNFTIGATLHEALHDFQFALREKAEFVLASFVLGSLNTPCPKCGHLITPAEIKRITWDEIECPAGSEQFDSAVSRQARNAQEG